MTRRTLLGLPVAVAAARVPMPAQSPGPPKLRALILTGRTDLPYHDWRQTAPFLRAALENTGRFSVHVLEEVAGATARTLAPYDLLVLNYNGPRWGAETERAVEDFVRGGKGMVAIHGVSYGEFFGMVFDKRWRPGPGPGWSAYPEMIGSSWEPDKVGHAVRHAFTVKVDPQDAITRGMEPQFVVNDELYHRLTLKPRVQVVARAFSAPEMGGTGAEEPVAWKVSFGQGRVFHTPLGHDTNAMYNEGFVTLLARGAEWAAAGSVTLPPRLPIERPKNKDAVRVLFVTGGHSYEPDIYKVLDGWDDLCWQHATSQSQAFQPGMEKNSDVLVLYDMANEIGETEMRSLRAFVDAGRGVVALHHSIVDYTSWPWWYEEVIGGKYYEKPLPGHEASHYQHDVMLVCRPVKGRENHPVIRGVGDLVTLDEAYRGMWHSPRITVLMETDHPLNDKPVVYLGPRENGRAVYIQLGHGPETMNHPGYRLLIHNAVHWAAGRAA